MTPLADMIPAMTDADLVTLRANAARLVEHGASTQVIAASDILPVIDAEVARRAQLRGVPVVALAGSLGHGAPAVHDVGIGAIASIITVPMPLSEAVANGEKLLADAAERTMRMILLGAAVSARAGQRKRKKAV